MSNNQEETGRFVLPAKEFPGFRRGLIEAYNKRIDREYALARRYYDRLIEQGKGKRGFNYGGAFRQMWQADQQRDSFSWAPHTEFDTMDSLERVEAALFRDARFGRGIDLNITTKPYAPRKKDFPKLAANAAAIHGDEWVIAFHPEKRAVGWEVDENNHSVDRAHEHPLAREFFQALSRVPWTRNTGGYIEYRDEYNRESINQLHGPLGEREQKARHDALSAYIKAHHRP